MCFTANSPSTTANSTGFSCTFVAGGGEYPPLFPLVLCFFIKFSSKKREVEEVEEVEEVKEDVEEEDVEEVEGVE